MVSEKEKMLKDLPHKKFPQSPAALNWAEVQRISGIWKFEVKFGSVVEEVRKCVSTVEESGYMLP